MLKLGKYTFKEDLTTRESNFMFFPAEDGEPASWSVDCSFIEGKYGEEEIYPAVCINPIETKASSVEELVGESFCVNSVEECEEREDLFTICEMYPMCRYQIDVLEISGNKAHVKCSGTAIVEEFDEETKTEDFELDVWLPIIVDADDWGDLN